MAAAVSDGQSSAERPGWREFFAVWTAIGLNSFGGPTGQIAVMHRELVERRRWIGESRFLHALNYCMLLPGPEAMQLATYIGWLTHRTLGGLVAGTLFVLPGFLSILALSLAYTTFRSVSAMEGLLLGLQAAVLAIVVGAVARMGRRILRNVAMVAVAAAAFVGIHFFELPFPLIILGAAMVGLVGDRLWPELFELIGREGPIRDDTPALVDRLDDRHTRPAIARSARTLATWLTIWLAPVAGVHLWFGPDNVFAAQARFFSAVSVMTFGGAYAVLAYVSQRAVDVYGWLTPREMLVGLGMAESTPGPLIQVVQFVGYLGAYGDPGALSPVVAGVLASILVTWVTFAPSFLWIFLGAPYAEGLRGRPGLSAALSTITAAVVGVVLNLALWFGLHTLFGRLSERREFGMRLIVPEWSSLDLVAVAIALVAAVCLFILRWSPLRTVAVASLIGAATALR